MFPSRTAMVAESRLRELCAQYLRDPVMVQYADPDTFTLVFDPPLTTAEAADFTELQAVARTTVSGISAAEWIALKPDLAGLRTYAGIASPTLAQTVSAVKAQSRILRALLRDG